MKGKHLIVNGRRYRIADVTNNGTTLVYHTPRYIRFLYWAERRLARHEDIWPVGLLYRLVWWRLGALWRSPQDVGVNGDWRID